MGPPALKLVEGGLVPVNSASAPSPRRPLPQYASLPPIADRRGGWDVPTNCAGDLALTRPHSLDAFVPLTSPPSEGGQGLFPHSTSSLGEQLRGGSSRQREDDLGERLPESFRSHPTGRRFHTPSVAASPRHLPPLAPPLGRDDLRAFALRSWLD